VNELLHHADPLPLRHRDALFVSGKDLRALPLIEPKAMLKKVLRPKGHA
jgi:hypothetical protein